MEGYTFESKPDVLQAGGAVSKRRHGPRAYGHEGPKMFANVANGILHSARLSTFPVSSYSTISLARSSTSPSIVLP